MKARKVEEEEERKSTGRMSWRRRRRKVDEAIRPGQTPTSTTPTSTSPPIPIQPLPSPLLLHIILPPPRSSLPLPSPTRTHTYTHPDSVYIKCVLLYISFCRTVTPHMIVQYPMFSRHANCVCCKCGIPGSDGQPRRRLPPKKTATKRSLN